MQPYITNQQTYGIHRKYNIKQRKLAWLIRQHPNLYRNKRGPQWVIGAHYDLTKPTDVETAFKATTDELMNALANIYAAKTRIYQKRKHEPTTDD